MAKNNNQKSKARKMDGRSKNVWKEKLERLQQELPEVLSENEVDCDQLKRLVGDENVAESERYQFTWAGKSNAFQEIKKRTTVTLKPDKEESVNFDKTENLFIEGENLEVLRILQKTYYGRVKMIYIDPPYNTGNDLIYNDQFAETREEYEERTGDVDEEGKKLRAFRKNTKESGHYHSNWLSMMYPRLYLARNLLDKDGVIFVSIDDNEVHNLRMMMNEIFGEENFVENLIWLNKEGGGGSDTKYFKKKEEYILAYAKNIESLTVHGVESEEDSDYRYQDEHVRERGKYKLIKLNSFSIQYSESLDYPIKLPSGKTVYPSENGKKGCWRWSKEKYEWGLKNDFIEFKENREGNLWVYTKQYFKMDYNGKPVVRTLPPLSRIDKYSSTLATKELETLLDGKYFEYPKPYQLMRFLAQVATKNNELILDFFAGSATTAHAIMDLNAKDSGNRKYIMVQLPEETDEDSEARKAGYKNIAQIGRERIRRAAKSIKQEAEHDFDAGFKAFTLSPSNFKSWRREEIESVEKLQQKLKDIVDNVKEGARKENMLFELMLKLGIDPNAKVEDKESYYSIEGGEYIICLAEKINNDLVENILSENPRVVVCLDNSFKGNDELKTNTALQMKSKDIEFKVI
jgi:adenine-specific DNA-methyltransferase